MSILQEYGNHFKYIGYKKIDAIQNYLDFLKEDNIILFYSDIIYKKDEWEKFEKWYEKVYNRGYGKSSEGDRCL